MSVNPIQEKTTQREAFHFTISANTGGQTRGLNLLYILYIIYIMIFLYTARGVYFTEMLKW